MNNPVKGCVAAALVLLMAGCTLGPEPERPVTAADAAESYVHGGSDFLGDRPDRE